MYLGQVASKCRKICRTLIIIIITTRYRRKCDDWNISPKILYGVPVFGRNTAMFLRPGIPPVFFPVPSLVDNDGVCCSVGIVIADVDVDAATAVAVGRSESSLLLLLLLSPSSLLSLYGRVCSSSSPSCTPWNGSSTLISRTVNVTFCNTVSMEGRRAVVNEPGEEQRKKERKKNET